MNNPELSPNISTLYIDVDNQTEKELNILKEKIYSAK